MSLVGTFVTTPSRIPTIFPSISDDPYSHGHVTKEICDDIKFGPGILAINLSNLGGYEVCLIRMFEK